MRILAVNTINNNYINSSKSLNNKTAVNISQPIKTIENNTLSEAIGRSQVVSFKGLNKDNGTYVQHECNELFKRTKETINYNKIDGSYIHTVTGYDGKLKRKEEYYPQLRKEVRTEVLDDNSKEITTILQDRKTTVTYNARGKELFYQEEKPGGYVFTRTTEYDKGRQVLFEKVSNGPSKISVIDLKTGLSVTSGPLVINERYDKTTDTYYTENLVTGVLYKKAQYFQNGKLKNSVEYYKDTPFIYRKIDYNSKNNEYEDAIYDKNGKLEYFAYVSKDHTYSEIFEYAQDGKTVTKHYEEKYNKNGDLVSEIVYEPNSNIICTETNFLGNNRSETVYSRNPNIPSYTDDYKGNIKVRTKYYREDGKTCAAIKEYKQNGCTFTTNYTFSGYKYSTDKRDRTGFIYESILYHEGYDTPKIVTKFEKSSNRKTELYYDIKTGILTTRKVYNNGRISEAFSFYEDGSTPRYKKIYNSDGSYRKYSYDIHGRLTGSDDYYANGTKKNSSYQQYRNGNNGNNNSNHRTSQTTGTNPNTQNNQSTMDYEALQRIQKIVTCSSRMLTEIDDGDWDVLTKITGISKDGLINLEHATYRDLLKRFHPDANINNPLLEINKTVYVIINGLNLRKK